MLVALLTVMAIGSVAFAVVFLDRARVLGDPAASGHAKAQAFDRVDRAGMLYQLGVLVTGVLWIRWQLYFVRNVRTLGRPTGFEPGWTIGGWLLPGINLVVPQHQLAVSARSSDPGPSPSTPGALYAWWAVSVTTVALLILGSGAVLRPQGAEFTPVTYDDFQLADRVHALCFAAACAAAILGAVTVFVCTNRQEQLVAELR